MAIDITNVHPHWRFLLLTHIRQVRIMMHEGRQVIDCQRIIKQARMDMLAIRRALRSEVPNRSY